MTTHEERPPLGEPTEGIGARAAARSAGAPWIVGLAGLLLGALAGVLITWAVLDDGGAASSSAALEAGGGGSDTDGGAEGDEGAGTGSISADGELPLAQACLVVLGEVERVRDALDEGARALASLEPARVQEALRALDSVSDGARGQVDACREGVGPR